MIDHGVSAIIIIYGTYNSSTYGTATNIERRVPKSKRRKKKETIKKQGEKTDKGDFLLVFRVVVVRTGNGAL